MYLMLGCPYLPLKQIYKIIFNIKHFSNKKHFLSLVGNNKRVRER